MRGAAIYAALALGLAALAGNLASEPSVSAHATVDRALSDEEFWAITTGFSEREQAFRPSGDYVSDNLVSNERSSQDVLPDLGDRPGGAYIGVGPEQNLTYIAALNPSLGFIVDIRRDNQLLQLMYKALIEVSPDRREFVSRLFGREVERSLARDAAIEELMADVADSRVSPSWARDTDEMIAACLRRGHALSISDRDVARIIALHHAFIAGGPDIRWASEWRLWMPTFRELMEQKAPNGERFSFLSSESRFHAVQRAEKENRIVPVIGDFGGRKRCRRLHGTCRGADWSFERSIRRTSSRIYAANRSSNFA